MLKQKYYALIYPYLNYGIIVWGCASNTILNCLRIKQNKCLQSIFFAHARESARLYYKLLGILKLDNINSDYAALHIRLRMELIALQMSSLMS